MANQQLSDYVKQQLAKGASKESIRSALLGVGWQESDVKEALGETVTPVVAAPVSVSPVQPAAARPAASPAQTAVPVAAAPASVASASPSVSPVKAPVAETIKTVQMPDIKASPMVDMNSPSFRMDEIIFQSENKGSTPKTADPLKDAAVAKIAPVDAPKSAPSSSSKLLPALAIIVLAIELAAGGWFYYTNVMNSECRPS
jgi:hypothetical protein